MTSDMSADDCLAGGGQMGAAMRSIDWSKTAAGPVESWSPTLRVMLRTLLVNGQPMVLWWGPSFIHFYNDAFWPALGAKHPRAMGQPGFDTAARRVQTGLGLVSMRERLRLVLGTINIESTPAQGTTVMVRVPTGV